MAGDLKPNLLESENKFRFLFNNPTDDIWIYDLTSARFLYFSRAVERITGYTVEEAVA